MCFSWSNAAIITALCYYFYRICCLILADFKELSSLLHFTVTIMSSIIYKNEQNDKQNGHRQKGETKYDSASPSQYLENGLSVTENDQVGGGKCGKIFQRRSSRNNAVANSNQNTQKNDKKAVVELSSDTYRETNDTEIKTLSTASTGKCRTVDKEVKAIRRCICFRNIVRHSVAKSCVKDKRKLNDTIDVQTSRDSTTNSSNQFGIVNQYSIDPEHAISNDEFKNVNLIECEHFATQDENLQKNNESEDCNNDNTTLIEIEIDKGSKKKLSRSQVVQSVQDKNTYKSHNQWKPTEKHSGVCTSIGRKDKHSSYDRTTTSCIIIGHVEQSSDVIHIAHASVRRSIIDANKLKKTDNHFFQIDVVTLIQSVNGPSIDVIIGRKIIGAKLKPPSHDDTTTIWNEVNHDGQHVITLERVICNATIVNDISIPLEYGCVENREKRMCVRANAAPIKRMVETLKDYETDEETLTYVGQGKSRHKYPTTRQKNVCLIICHPDYSAYWLTIVELDIVVIYTEHERASNDHGFEVGKITVIPTVNGPSVNDNKGRKITGPKLVLSSQDEVNTNQNEADNIRQLTLILEKGMYSASFVDDMINQIKRGGFHMQETIYGYNLTQATQMVKKLIAYENKKVKQTVCEQRKTSHNHATVFRNEVFLDMYHTESSKYRMLSALSVHQSNDDDIKYVSKGLLKRMYSVLAFMFHQSNKRKKTTAEALQTRRYQTTSNVIQVVVVMNRAFGYGQIVDFSIYAIQHMCNYVETDCVETPEETLQKMVDAKFFDVILNSPVHPHYTLRGGESNETNFSMGNKIQASHTHTTVDKPQLNSVKHFASNCEQRYSRLEEVDRSKETYMSQTQMKAIVDHNEETISSCGKMTTTQNQDHPAQHRSISSKQSCAFRVTVKQTSDIIRNPLESVRRPIETENSKTVVGFETNKSMLIKIVTVTNGEAGCVQNDNNIFCWKQSIYNGIQMDSETTPFDLLLKHSVESVNEPTVSANTEKKDAVSNVEQNSDVIHTVHDRVRRRIIEANKKKKTKNNEFAIDAVDLTQSVHGPSVDVTIGANIIRTTLKPSSYGVATTVWKEVDHDGHLAITFKNGICNATFVNDIDIQLEYGCVENREKRMCVRVNASPVKQMLETLKYYETDEVTLTYVGQEKSCQKHGFEVGKIIVILTVNGPSVNDNKRRNITGPKLEQSSQDEVNTKQNEADNIRQLTLILEKGMYSASFVDDMTIQIKRNGFHMQETMYGYNLTQVTQMVKKLIAYENKKVKQTVCERRKTSHDHATAFRNEVFVGMYHTESSKYRMLSALSVHQSNDDDIKYVSKGSLKRMYSVLAFMFHQSNKRKNTTAEALQTIRYQTTSNVIKDEEVMHLAFSYGHIVVFAIYATQHMCNYVETDCVETPEETLQNIVDVEFIAVDLNSPEHPHYTTSGGESNETNFSMGNKEHASRTHTTVDKPHLNIVKHIAIYCEQRYSRVKEVDRNKATYMSHTQMKAIVDHKEETLSSCDKMTTTHDKESPTKHSNIELRQRSCAIRATVKQTSDIIRNPLESVRRPIETENSKTVVGFETNEGMRIKVVTVTNGEAGCVQTDNNTFCWKQSIYNGIQMDYVTAPLDLLLKHTVESVNEPTVSANTERKEAVSNVEQNGDVIHTVHDRVRRRIIEANKKRKTKNNEFAIDAVDLIQFVHGHSVDVPIGADIIRTTYKPSSYGDVTTMWKEFDHDGQLAITLENGICNATFVNDIDIQPECGCVENQTKRMCVNTNATPKQELVKTRKDYDFNEIKLTYVGEGKVRHHNATTLQKDVCLIMCQTERSVYRMNIVEQISDVIYTGHERARMPIEFDGMSSITELISHENKEIKNTSVDADKSRYDHTTVERNKVAPVTHRTFGHVQDDSEVSVKNCEKMSNTADSRCFADTGNIFTHPVLKSTADARVKAWILCGADHHDFFNQSFGESEHSISGQQDESQNYENVIENETFLNTINPQCLELTDNNLLQTVNGPEVDVNNEKKLALKNVEQSNNEQPKTRGSGADIDCVSISAPQPLEERRSVSEVERLYKTHCRYKKKSDDDIKYVSKGFLKKMYSVLAFMFHQSNKRKKTTAEALQTRRYQTTSNVIKDEEVMHLDFSYGQIVVFAIYATQHMCNYVETDCVETPEETLQNIMDVKFIDIDLNCPEHPHYTTSGGESNETNFSMGNKEHASRTHTTVDKPHLNIVKHIAIYCEQRYSRVKEVDRNKATYMSHTQMKAIVDHNEETLSSCDKMTTTHDKESPTKHSNIELRQRSCAIRATVKQTSDIIRNPLESVRRPIETENSKTVVGFETNEGMRIKVVTVTNDEAGCVQTDNNTFCWKQSIYNGIQMDYVTVPLDLLLKHTVESVNEPTVSANTERKDAVSNVVQNGDVIHTVHDRVRRRIIEANKKKKTKNNEFAIDAVDLIQFVHGHSVDVPIGADIIRTTYKPSSYGDVTTMWKEFDHDGQLAITLENGICNATFVNDIDIQPECGCVENQTKRRCVNTNAIPEQELVKTRKDYDFNEIKLTYVGEGKVRHQHATTLQKDVCLIMCQTERSVYRKNIVEQISDVIYTGHERARMPIEFDGMSSINELISHENKEIKNTSVDADKSRYDHTTVERNKVAPVTHRTFGHVQDDSEVSVKNCEKMSNTADSRCFADTGTVFTHPVLKSTADARVKAWILCGADHHDFFNQSFGESEHSISGQQDESQNYENVIENETFLNTINPQCLELTDNNLLQTVNGPEVDVNNEKKLALKNVEQSNNEQPKTSWSGTDIDTQLEERRSVSEVERLYKTHCRYKKKSEYERIVSPLYMFRSYPENEILSMLVYPLRSSFTQIGGADQLRLSRDLMNNEWNRFVSFNGYFGNGNTFRLARNGFYHDAQNGPTSTACFFCHVRRDNWQPRDNITAEHCRECPLYRFTSNNIPIGRANHQIRASRNGRIDIQHEAGSNDSSNGQLENQSGNRHERLPTPNLIRGNGIRFPDVARLPVTTQNSNLRSQVRRRGPIADVRQRIIHLGGSTRDLNSRSQVRRRGPIADVRQRIIHLGGSTRDLNPRSQVRRHDPIVDLRQRIIDLGGFNRDLNSEWSRRGPVVPLFQRVDDNAAINRLNCQVVHGAMSPEESERTHVPDSDDNPCQKCRLRPAVIQPCGHSVCCKECQTRMRTCPQCSF